ncbi:hypothetical protein HGQ17_12785 [Nesterenkonia sp. MY13]|uniref:DUF4350 domain-containing protein n=1 Tax=Nesterenkonia sedimenti TaxID=1463632 RepID=A0A7X8YF18_9MICC|nr:DUF4350 domain-containing protein [Nesterenkonia sedimenti]NLS10852.1 hypothetical protein [Nesterenkonia sedimenti]
MSTASASTSSPAGLRGTASRWQFWVVLLCFGVIAALLLQLSETEDTEVYGLGNTDLDGYAALVSVLEEEGVEIRRAYSAQQAQELMDQDPEAGVVVQMRGFQPDQQFVSQLRDDYAGDRNVLWLSTNTGTLGNLFGLEAGPGPSIPTTGTGTADVLTTGDQCRHPAAAAAESIRAPGESLAASQGCFEVPGSPSGFLLTEVSAGTVFTAPEAFTNQHITAEGNAALALNLLTDGQGAEQQLIWYTPSGADTAEADSTTWASPFEYLPRWFEPLFWWLVVCALIAMFAAGRRYGPVVTEPMPVSVPAGETAAGRGRLYQRANATVASAEALRNAHLLRLARLLRVGRKAPAAAVAAAAAQALGTASGEPADLLAAPAQVRNNRQLVAYAQALSKLEDDVVKAVRVAQQNGEH